MRGEFRFRLTKELWAGFAGASVGFAGARRGRHLPQLTKDHWHMRGEFRFGSQRSSGLALQEPALALQEPGWADAGLSSLRSAGVCAALPSRGHGQARDLHEGRSSRGMSRAVEHTSSSLGAQTSLTSELYTANCLQHTGVNDYLCAQVLSTSMCALEHVSPRVLSINHLLRSERLCIKVSLEHALEGGSPGWL